VIEEFEGWWPEPRLEKERGARNAGLFGAKELRFAREATGITPGAVFVDDSIVLKEVVRALNGEGRGDFDPAYIAPIDCGLSEDDVGGVTNRATVSRVVVGLELEPHFVRVSVFGDGEGVGSDAEFLILVKKAPFVKGVVGVSGGGYTPGGGKAKFLDRPDGAPKHC